MWKCTKKQWKQIDRDARLIKRANGDLEVLYHIHGLQGGVVELAGWGTTIDPSYDLSVYTLANDLSLDKRKWNADRLKFYRSTNDYCTWFSHRLP